MDLGGGSGVGGKTVNTLEGNKTVLKECESPNPKSQVLQINFPVALIKAQFIQFLHSKEV